MEIAIGIGIGMIIAVIIGKRKKHDTQHSKPGINTERRGCRQEIDEELITVVLPTINNDK